MPEADATSLILKDLFSLNQRLDSLTWEEFRPGVRIHRLYGNQSHGPSAALLLYEPGAGIPMHEHSGYEHLLILAGFQTEERGPRAAGTFMINPPGTAHSVCFPNGGVVLAIWEKPVAFVAQ